jgi:two-component system chemotaxis sensor kinase CheA
MPPVDLSRFRDTFFEEAAEHTATIEQSLLAVEDASDQREVLDAIFRAAHSIKGASGVFGLTAVMQFTHGLESVLDRLRESTLACDRSTIDLLLAANDVLKALLDAAQTNEAPPESMGPVLDALHALVGAPPAHTVETQEDAGAAASQTQGVRIRFRPSADILRQGLDPLVLIRELAELGELASIELDTTSLPAADAFEPETCYLAWTFVLHTSATVSAVRDVFLFAEDGAELDVQPIDSPAAAAESVGPALANDAAAASTAVPATTATSPTLTPSAQNAVASPNSEERRAPGDRRRSLEGASLRVPTQKVDRLIDLVGEIAIAQSIVTNLIDSFTPARLGQLRDAVGLLERNTRELQERVMGIRMVPIGGVFSRFPRLVRDVAAGLAKDVRVEMIGEDTELDKVVVERIGDPLTHLVRNAVDHGLETPEARLAAGKPAEGLIRLGAYQRGGAVVIEVEDDGRGLDVERIRAKALTQGLITATQAQTLPAEALHQLIFEPGFSTAAAVSDLSGRGVGMDVVKRNVEELNGSVTVDSRPGRGTTVRISLPLTLAIMDGQSLAIGETVYVLPLTAIVESLRPKRGEVTTVLGTGEVVRVRGEAVPLVRLHRYLGVTPTHTDPCEAIVILVEYRGRRAALMADELRGQHQVVIKSLDAHYRRVEGVMGATIMGDGSVALILDAPGLLRMSESQARAHTAPAA